MWHNLYVFAILLLTTIIINEESMKWTEVPEMQVEKQQWRASHLSHFQYTHCLLCARRVATCLLHICNPRPQIWTCSLPCPYFYCAPLGWCGWSNTSLVLSLRGHYSGSVVWHGDEIVNTALEGHGHGSHLPCRGGLSELQIPPLWQLFTDHSS